VTKIFENLYILRACFAELEKSFGKIYRQIIDRDTILVHHSRGSYKHDGVKKKKKKRINYAIIRMTP